MIEITKDKIKNLTEYKKWVEEVLEEHIAHLPLYDYINGRIDSYNEVLEELEKNE